MASVSFDEFVRRENQAARALDQEQIDWQARKEYWLNQLRQLFAHIEEYLKPYSTKGQVRFEERTVHLNEEFIGSYSAPELLITIGSKTIRLEPIGANVLLAKGRVDIEGPLARAQLLLIDNSSQFMVEQKHPYLPWKILTPPPSGRGFQPLDAELVDRDNFLNLLQEVANG